MNKLDLLRTSGLMLAYLLTGQLGLLLAIPPGYATAIWPPSGIALAGVLLFGYRVWPGILVGSFLINVQIHFDTIGLSNSVVSILLPTIILCLGF